MWHYVEAPDIVKVIAFDICIRIIAPLFKYTPINTRMSLMINGYHGWPSIRPLALGCEQAPVKIPAIAATFKESQLKPDIKISIWIHSNCFKLKNIFCWNSLRKRRLKLPWKHSRTYHIHFCIHISLEDFLSKKKKPSFFEH